MTLPIACSGDRSDLIVAGAVFQGQLAGHSSVFIEGRSISLAGHPVLSFTSNAPIAYALPGPRDLFIDGLPVHCQGTPNTSGGLTHIS